MNSDRISDMERKPIWRPDLFEGNWNLFNDVIGNPNTIMFIDADGITTNSSELVHSNFSKETGIKVFPKDINHWHYLRNVARENGLSEEIISHVEDDYYDPKVLFDSRQHLWIKPLILQTIKYYGADSNFILTSRKPYLKKITRDWFYDKFRMIPEKNILIREDESVDSATFKVNEMREKAKISPWVVLIDDSTEYAREVLKSDIKNCIVINVPQGKTRPDFEHERLFVVGRYPVETQEMYPLLSFIKQAISI